MAEKFFKSFFPSIKAQEEAELVNPQEVLREECNKNGHVESLFGKYQACNDRVNSKKQTAETCTEELFDYLHELDHCVAHTLFSKLK
ncbi:Cytochrome b-c1 complex subunit 6, mitochondrial [Pseudolycoriella hygida]|uniref:Cytochrome b-c1 complex subunit 6 n=1 Tax=Pseudolycoriella hygida TaxID=35572 RepID=A0A9Q0RVF4_9DIPT|nr:Cytochrome b-c1 complex subunit 6, mitochondrial [Pseudolycoriella hygida]